MCCECHQPLWLPTIDKTFPCPITERNPKLVERGIVGVPAKLHYCGDEDLVLPAVDDALDALIRDGISDFVIVSDPESLRALPTVAFQPDIPPDHASRG